MQIRQIPRMKGKLKKIPQETVLNSSRRLIQSKNKEKAKWLHNLMLHIVQEWKISPLHCKSKDMK
jgi:hypothetical protein